jgi:hydroxypyruvate reductase
VDAAASLEANDSYAYLRVTGDLLVTGPTGTNVNDLVVALVAGNRD